MASIRIRLPLAVATVAVLFAVALSSSGVVTRSVSTVIDDAAQLAAGLSAAVACLWTARYRRGVERGWRGLVGTRMAGRGHRPAVWAGGPDFPPPPPPHPAPARPACFPPPGLPLAAPPGPAPARAPPR